MQPLEQARITLGNLNIEDDKSGILHFGNITLFYFVFTRDILFEFFKDNVDYTKLREMYDVATNTLLGIYDKIIRFVDGNKKSYKGN